MLLPTRVVILLIILQICLVTFKTEAGVIGPVGKVESGGKEKNPFEEKTELPKMQMKTFPEESTKKLATETQKSRDQLTPQEKVPHDQAIDVKKSQDPIIQLQNLLKEEFTKNMTICFNQLSNCRLENNIQTKNSNCTDSISFKQVKRNLTICQRDVYILNATSKAVNSEIRHLTYELSNCKVNATLAEMKIDQITQQLPKIKNLKIVG